MKCLYCFKPTTNMVYVSVGNRPKEHVAICDACLGKYKKRERK